MSQDKVNKIVFCSLDEYKALNKEENTGYIIDAKMSLRLLQTVML